MAPDIDHWEAAIGRSLEPKDILVQDDKYYEVTNSRIDKEKNSLTRKKIVVVETRTFFPGLGVGQLKREFSLSEEDFNDMIRHEDRTDLENSTQISLTTRNKGL